MERTITISEELFLALQHMAEHRQESTDSLAESWLKQLLNLDNYPDLEWREAVGGWRVGLKDTAIDVYTGKTPKESWKSGGIMLLIIPTYRMPRIMFTTKTTVFTAWPIPRIS